MGDVFEDLDKLRLNSLVIESIASPKNQKLPRHKRNEWFLYIPWSWWVCALRMTQGKVAVAAASVVWRRATRMKSQTVTITFARLKEEIGLNRWAARRGLLALEKAGLVSLKRPHGRAFIVTLLNVNQKLAEAEEKVGYIR
jgi:hypothetical protein